MTTARRTKRRYAHELFPHADEYEVRPLSVEVPYLYARAIGFGVFGTGWHDAPWETDQWAKEASSRRLSLLIESCHKALLADALLQGMTGDQAWAWATERMDEAGEWIYERAVHYSVDPDLIKPYSCGPVTEESLRVDGCESEYIEPHTTTEGETE